MTFCFFLRFFLLLPFARNVIFGAVIDNRVLSTPEVRCSDDEVQLEFATENPFDGRIFVKGFSDNPDCVNMNETRRTSIKVSFGDCRARRKRSLTPAGLTYSLVIIINFHPPFITMVDRAYNVRCFFMEAEKKVDTSLNVGSLESKDGELVTRSSNDTADLSLLSTVATITGTAPMPVCKYEILHGGPMGLPMKYARLGDTAYHQWSCSTDTNDLFCMTVHSCYAENGDSDDDKELLLDQNGCAVDKYLINNLNYRDDLTAGQHTMVFKFADKPSLYFNCQIHIGIKNGTCTRTSDQCTTLRRRKRSIDSTSLDVLLETEVNSNDIEVFAFIVERPGLEDLPDVLNEDTIREIPGGENADCPSQRVCLSVYYISLLGCLVLVISVFSCVLTWICIKLRLYSVKQ